MEVITELPYTVVSGKRRCMLAPENVTSRWQETGGVNISWDHHHQHHEAGCEFVIEYRTVGQWVPLAVDVSRTWYVWRTASRGAVYHFRVTSLDHSNSLRSPPSQSVSMETGGTSRHLVIELTR